MRRMNKILASVGVIAFAFTLASTSSTAFAADPAFQVPVGQRQLFLDDVGIAAMENLQRTMHRPAKKGAVIRPKPKEKIIITLCPPMWIPEKKIYRIWLLDSYAESTDGLLWTRPPYTPPDGIPNFHGAVYDPFDPDPSRRFKGMTGTREGLRPIASDGVVWRRLDVPSVAAGDTNILHFDTQERLFIATVRQNGKYGRAVAISTSKDFEHWTKPELIFHADELDQELGRRAIKARLADPTLQGPRYNDPSHYKVDIYDMAVFRYEGLYIGMPLVYYICGPVTNYPNTEGFHHIQLMCSRDLRNWKRLGDRKAFIGPSRVDSGAYDLTQLGPCSPILRSGEDTYSGQDELWFYYNGTKYRAGWTYVGKFPNGKHVPIHGLDPDTGAICLAVLRRDGFFSLDAGETEGTVQTKPFKVSATRLFVNVNAFGGKLRVELLNADGGVVAQSEALTGDLPGERVKWLDGDLADLQDQTASLRFTLRNGQFYSYWLQ